MEVPWVAVGVADEADVEEAAARAPDAGEELCFCGFGGGGVG